MLQLLRKIVKLSFFFLPDRLVSNIIFEAVAFMGSLVTKPLKLETGERNFINLGSGSNILSGCINIDFFLTHGIDYGADLRRKLKISDGTVDGIFCEHTIEHLSYKEADLLLHECHRIMKPGAVIRVVLPDIALFIEHYASGDVAWFKRWEQLMFTESTDPERSVRHLATPMQALSFVTQEYGHASAWDVPTITLYLEQSGFRSVKQNSFLMGQCPELVLDLNSEDRKFVSLYVEAVK